MKIFKYLLSVILVCSLPQLIHCQSWQWVSRIGGNGIPVNTDIPDEMVTGMVTDSMGNVYACGRIIGNGSTDVNGVPVSAFGGYDLFVAKFDCNGNLVWIKTAGNNQDGDQATHILMDGFGHIYVAGNIWSQAPLWCNFMGTIVNETTNDMFLCKLDTAGNLLWVKWAAPGNSIMGSRVYGMDFTNSGNIKIMFIPLPGTIFPGFTINQSGLYIGEFDTSGNFLNYFGVIYGGGNQVFNLRGMKNDVNNNSYIIGDFSSDSIIVMGQTLYKISNPGSSRSDLFVVKVNNSSNLDWINQISVNDSIVNRPFGIQLMGTDFYIAANGRYGMLGSNFLSNNLSLNNFPYVAKFNASGQVQWAVNTNNQGPVAPNGGIISKTGSNLVISGQFISDLNVGTTTLSSPGSRSIYLAELDTSGNWISAEMLEANGTYNYPQTMAFDKDDNIFIGGGFEGPIIFNGNPITSAGGYTDGFIAKFGSICTVGFEEPGKDDTNQLSIYPNPVSTELTVNVLIEDVKQISIVNLLGEKVMELKPTSNQTSQFTIPVQHLPDGIYMVQVRGRNSHVTGKFIKVK
jgi:hypothetical protein